MASNKNSAQTAVTIVKIVAVILALLMIAYVTLSLVYHSWNPAKWTQVQQGQNKPNTDDKDPSGSIADKSDQVILDINENNSGVKLMKASIAPEDFAENGISAQAESAFTLTATVTDITGNTPAGIQYVNFDMPENDSIKMTVVDDVTATFECLKAFDTYITVTVFSAFDTSKKTTVRFGYMPKITGMTFDWEGTSYTIGKSDAEVLDLTLQPLSGWTGGSSAYQKGITVGREAIIYSIGTETINKNYTDVKVSFALYGPLMMKYKEITGDNIDNKEFTKNYSVASGVPINVISEMQLYQGVGITSNMGYNFLSAINQNADIDFSFNISFSGEHFTGTNFIFKVRASVPGLKAIGGVNTSDTVHIF